MIAMSKLEVAGLVARKPPIGFYRMTRIILSAFEVAEDKERRLFPTSTVEPD